MDEKTRNPLDKSRPVNPWDEETAHPDAVNLEADNLDALIDNALGTYTAAEPSRDLSARILDAAHALEPRKRSGLRLLTARPWAFAAAGWLAAAAMLLVFIHARHLQIVVQLRPAAAQLALSTPPKPSPFPTPAPSNSAPKQAAPLLAHLQHTTSTAISLPHAQPSGRTTLLQPIAFAPIVLAPIGSEERN
jgi:hypothetical protein